VKFSTFVSSKIDIDKCTEAANVAEVLIETSLLAREGRLSLSEAKALAVYATEKKLRPVLVWDILMTEEEFLDCTKSIQELGTQHFSAIRVQCIGAARYLKESFPSLSIQLIAENANCNLATLLSWCSSLGKQLDRIILSIQLPAEKIVEFVQKLPVQTEILGLGRILLFYSRRNLLIKNFESLGEEWREVLAESEESNRRPFPIIDNRHGTFMYLDKDQYILHKLDAITAGCPTYFRIDLRHLSEFPRSAFDIETISVQALSNPEDLRKNWPRPTIAPFFKSNLTTKQFKLLNSELRFNRDDTCVAEIVSTERDRHCVLRVVQPFTLPGKFKVLDPGGVEVEKELLSLKTLAGEEITSANTDQVLIAPWIKKISTGSLMVKA
jgi:putative protease